MPVPPDESLDLLYLIHADNLALGEGCDLGIDSDLFLAGDVAGGFG